MLYLPLPRLFSFGDYILVNGEVAIKVLKRLHVYLVLKLKSLGKFINESAETQAALIDVM